jgi:hypothetical protein
MNPMTEAQKASLNRHVKRAVGRIHDEPENIPLFIRISESDLYDWDLYTRSTLKEICYMRAGAWHEGDLRKPEKSPFKAETYQGWCYAKQETIAERVGCSPDAVNDAIKLMVADGVLIVREYKEYRNGKYVVTHYEYSINEQMVNDHKRFGERKPSGRKANKGCFKKTSDKSDGVMENHTPSQTVPNHLANWFPTTSPTGFQPPRQTVDNQLVEMADNQQSYVRSSVPEFVDGVRSLSPPPSGTHEEDSLRSSEPKEKSKSKAKAIGVGGMGSETKASPKSKPAHNLAAYLDDEEPEVVSGRTPTPAPARFGRMATFPDDDPELDGVTAPPSAPRAFDVEEA